MRRTVQYLRGSEWMDAFNGKFPSSWSGGGEVNIHEIDEITFDTNYSQAQKDLLFFSPRCGFSRSSYATSPPLLCSVPTTLKNAFKQALPLLEIHKLFLVLAS